MFAIATLLAMLLASLPKIDLEFPLVRVVETGFQKQMVELNITPT